MSRTMPTASVHFNPRSPHGERLENLLHTVRDYIISIHAPRTGSDVGSVLLHRFMYTFQSTLPARGATLVSSLLPKIISYFNPRSPHGERRRSGQYTAPDSQKISIHAPRTGSDGERLVALILADDFNPRSPHGERPAQNL